jgi:hypothetical protein
MPLRDLIDRVVYGIAKQSRDWVYAVRIGCLSTETRANAYTAEYARRRCPGAACTRTAK